LPSFGGNQEGASLGQRGDVEARRDFGGDSSNSHFIAGYKRSGPRESSSPVFGESSPSEEEEKREEERDEKDEKEKTKITSGRWRAPPLPPQEPQPSGGQNETSSGLGRL